MGEGRHYKAKNLKDLPKAFIILNNFFPKLIPDCKGIDVPNL